MEQIAKFIEKNKWVVIGFYLSLFLLIGLLCNGFSELLSKSNNGTLRLIKTTTDVVPVCFACLAITIAEIIYWRKIILDELSSFNMQKDEFISNNENEILRIHSLAFKHMSSWISWHGFTILYLSVLLVLSYLLINEHYLLYLDIAFISLLIYWTTYTALLFNFTWSDIIENNFKDYVSFYKEYDYIFKTIAQLESDINTVSGQLTKKERVRFLKNKVGISKNLIADYISIISFKNSVEKTGYKKGIKSYSEKLSRLTEVLNPILSQLSNQ